MNTVDGVTEGAIDIVGISSDALAFDASYASYSIGAAGEVASSLVVSCT